MILRRFCTFYCESSMEMWQWHTYVIQSSFSYRSITLYLTEWQSFIMCDIFLARFETCFRFPIQINSNLTMFNWNKLKCWCYFCFLFLIVFIKDVIIVNNSLVINTIINATVLILLISDRYHWYHTATFHQVITIVGADEYILTST